MARKGWLATRQSPLRVSSQLVSDTSEGLRPPLAIGWGMIGGVGVPRGFAFGAFAALLNWPHGVRSMSLIAPQSERLWGEAFTLLDVLIDGAISDIG